MTKDAINKQDHGKLLADQMHAAAVIGQIVDKCEKAASAGLSSAVIMKGIDCYLKRRWFRKTELIGPLREVILACNEAGLKVEVAEHQVSYHDWENRLIAYW
jgi:hypothetical protein